MERTRSTTLAVVDKTGAVWGAVGPLTIALPWWQESGPIADAIPGVTVLRLLSATPEPGMPMGGHVSYLVEADDDALECFGRDGVPPLEPWAGSLDEQPLRHPWAEPGGPAADLAWVNSVVPVTGPPRQHRTWNLSAVWSIPTEAGTVWLKCLPPFFAHEIGVLEQLADLGGTDPSVPQLIAADGHRCLMAELPGEDGYEATEDEQIEMVQALVDLQVQSIDRIDGLLNVGVPDLRTPRLISELRSLVERVAPDRPLVAKLVAELPERLDAANRTGLPDTLVHGDPHGGNCRRGVSPPIWFDWGDSFIGNPLLDVAALHRMPPAAVDRWLDRWRNAIPGSDPRAAWDRLEPVATLRMAWVYQRFLDNIEPAEHIYHRDDVPETLDRVEALMAASTT